MKSTILFGLFFVSVSTAGFGQKLAPEDILAKNIASIGSAETLAKLKNVTAVGTVSFVQGTTDKNGAPGKAVIASEGPKLVTGMSFPIPVYPLERITSDG